MKLLRQTIRKLIKENMIKDLLDTDDVSFINQAYELANTSGDTNGILEVYKKARSLARSHTWVSTSLEHARLYEIMGEIEANYGIWDFNAMGVNKMNLTKKQLRKILRETLILESDDYVPKLLNMLAQGDGFREQAFDLAETLEIDLDAVLIRIVKPIFEKIDQQVHTPSTAVPGPTFHKDDSSGWHEIKPFSNTTTPPPCHFFLARRRGTV